MVTFRFHLSSGDLGGVWSWESHLTSLFLSFLICKIGLIIAPTSQINGKYICMLSMEPSCRKCSILSLVTLVFDYVILSPVAVPVLRGSPSLPYFQHPSSSQEQTEVKQLAFVVLCFKKFIFWLYCVACGILSFPTRDWTWASVVEVRSLNHWTIRKVLDFGFYSVGTCCYCASALKCETFLPSFTLLT